MLTFTDEEKALIARLSVPGGWDDTTGPTVALKRKIKDHFLARGAICCYCLRTMGGWHRMTIDVEHVLPKSIYPQFTFETKNLNLSCKRCNMQVKGERVSFYVGTLATAAQFLSAEYSFVHPNLDPPGEHIRLIFLQYSAVGVLLNYSVTPGSTKGAATYDFFRLEELECNSFDAAQGANPVEPSAKMSSESAEQLRTILSAIT